MVHVFAARPSGSVREMSTPRTSTGTVPVFVTVTVIGIGTVAAYINAGGLGSLIFSGIAQTNGAKIASGAVIASAMAVLADWGLLRLQRRLVAGARA